MPTLLNFIHTNKDEHIIYFLRHHWITFVGSILLNLVLAGVPLFGWLFISSIAPNFFDQPLAQALTLLGLSAYYLTLWLFSFNHFLSYFLDIWVVTNKRIIDVQQHGLWKRTVAEQPLSRVQDVTSEVSGIFATMFGYGNITVQTASENEKFIFKNIPHPNQISQEIMAVIERERHL